MIDREYCVIMARYNLWQNNQLHVFLNVMDVDELSQDRGAFFGSILGTLNHLIWGDQIWMSRFDGGDGPAVGIPESIGMHATLDEWRKARTGMDARILHWAGGVNDEDLQRDMTWFSGAMGCEVTRNAGLLATHFFNHQTHHRGQIHAMLTASGSKAPVTDLFFMPDDI